MQLLSRTTFFGGGHKLSGLDPVHLGATVSAYRGRGQIRPPVAAGRQTIAQRRAAEAALPAEGDGEPGPGPDPGGTAGRAAPAGTERTSTSATKGRDA
jgi:preprotein translocase subunit SecD